MSSNATDTNATSRTTRDRVVLTLPGTQALRGVATLVLGGIGSRLDLPYEKVDDLQLATLSVLSAGVLETVTIDVTVTDDEVLVRIGPLPDGVAADPGLMRVLARLVDTAAPTGSDDAAGEGPGADDWVALGLRRAPSAASST
jgi:hypothetical protein